MEKIMNKVLGKSNNNLLLLMFTLVGLTACHTPPPPITSGIGAESITNETPPTTYLKVDNLALAEKLAISEVKNRTTNDLLEVNVELSSQYKKSLTLQYHFNWFDKNGFVVEAGKSPWRPLQLHGHQSRMLKGVAPSIAATSFNVYVREAHSNAYEDE